MRSTENPTPVINNYYTLPQILHKGETAEANIPEETQSIPKSHDNPLNQSVQPSTTGMSYISSLKPAENEYINPFFRIADPIGTSAWPSKSPTNDIFKLTNPQSTLINYSPNDGTSINFFSNYRTTGSSALLNSVSNLGVSGTSKLFGLDSTPKDYEIDEILFPNRTLEISKQNPDSLPIQIRHDNSQRTKSYASKMKLELLKAGFEVNLNELYSFSSITFGLLDIKYKLTDTEFIIEVYLKEFKL